MSKNQNEPREYDAVRGGQNLIPVNAGVLGGIPGVKSRLASPIVEVRIAALSEALKYGEAGLDLIIVALHDASMQVKFAAYELLKEREDLKLTLPYPDSLPAFEFDVITVDAEGKENSRSKSFARYFSEDLGNGIELEMVYIPGGTFMMGSPETEKRRYDCEGPQHQVTVPAFFTGKYPITQAQWQAVMGYNPSRFEGEKHPVQYVSWHQSVEFCHKLAEKTGKNYRLPSEAEWEYACRAGTTTRFYFGDAEWEYACRVGTTIPLYFDYNFDYTITRDLVNCSSDRTTNVGSFPPNKFGLYDMYGQVLEWCTDRYHNDYNGAPTDGSSWETGSSTYRLIRGGSWKDVLKHCRSAVRGNFVTPDGHLSVIGFRVVCVAART